MLTTSLLIAFLGVGLVVTGDGCVEAGGRAARVVADSPFFGVRLPLPLLNEPAENHVFAVSGSVAAESSRTMSFVLPEAEGLTATLLGERLRWSFRAPNGFVIVPGETEDGTDYEYAGGGGVSGFHLKRPMKGRWTVVVSSLAQDSVATYAIDVELEGHFPVVAHLETIIDGDLPNARNFAKPGADVYVRVFIADRGRPIPGVRWNVEARTHADSSFVIPVYDDGKHADGIADDGIAVGAFRSQAREGGYSLRAACRGPDGSERIVPFFVDVNGLPD